MRIVCESCKTCFRLDDSKISDNVVKVRCSKCKHVFTVRRAKITSDSLKRLVAPGRYVVSRTGNQKLEAHLGTSVGVSLRDRTAGVGGLIHLLLPDPTGIDKPRQPEKYAETGLLLFIQAMCDLGARKQRLEACVAGGALLGSFSRKGSNLDIGGQTTEVVERILHREGIPVYESETGGCLGCCLSLDLQTWKTEIRPIGTDTAPAVTVFKKPTAEQLEQSMQQARPIPQIALKALRMIRDQRHSLEDVAQEIRQDQVISARVLKLCNSAFFGLRTKIESIDRALVLVGEKRFLQLIISLSLRDFFPQAEQGYSLSKGGLYKHALGTAVYAETLAQFTKKVSADVAYTGGLLHDIGKALLDQYITPAYPLFYQRIQVDGADLIAVERDAFGVSHTEIGAQLAKHWSLPESLVDTIGYHHQPEQATANPELTHLVYLTDLLMSRFLVGQELERLNTDRFVMRLERIGLSPSDLPILVDLIPQRVFEGSLFG